MPTLLHKIKDYHQAVGLTGLVSLLFCRLFHLPFHPENYDMMYFIKHHHLSNGIKDDLRDWRSFLDLKETYTPFIKSLPHYELKSKEKSKIIWWCWLQGEDKAPKLCQTCLNSLRRQFPDYHIVVVTEDNISKYVNFPDYIIEKLHKGIISRTHFSDILRTCLLVEHGGVWIDSTVLCTGYNEPVLDYPLFVFQDWKFDRQQASVCSNWFLSSWREEPILELMRDLLFEYWKRNDRLTNYFVYHQLFHLATEFYPEEWKAVPRFSNIPPHLLQFELFDNYSETRFEQIKRGADFHKLTYKHPLMQAGGKEGSFYNHLFLDD